MSFFAGLQTILSFLAAIPQLLKLINEIKSALAEMDSQKRASEESKRQDGLSTTLDNLKNDQAKGDANAQKNDLSSVIDDYNH